MPPVKPMLAKAVPDLPGETGTGLLYEPKYDGFRCIVFRDGDEIELGSRNERPLTRYFPELLPALLASLPDRCVVDGEVIVIVGDELDFGALQQRIHPAESRVTRLAAETPASFVAFDLLAHGDEDLTELPFAERRARLDAALGGAAPPVHVTPSTDDPALARGWFERFEGAGLDGLIAKPVDGTYVQDKRVQFKIKHQRTADVVVAGFRWHKDGEGVGSLLLGLYDDEGRLNHLGVASSFSAKRRKELLDELAPYREVDFGEHPWGEWAEAQAHASGEHGKMPGAVSRWNATKDLSFVPLRADLVAEVGYQWIDDGRFRGVARLLRWRPDRDATSCTFDQLEVPTPVGMAEVFGA